ncbi:MAG: Ig-like domain-containing protein [Gemmataceae bacterium]
MAFWIDAVMNGSWRSISNIRAGGPTGFQEPGVADVTAPAFAAPDTVTTSATGPGGARVDFAIPQVFDDFDLAPTVTFSPASGSVFPVGTTRVTVTARDASGNTSTKAFDVVVQPGEPVGVPETYLVNRKEFDVGPADGVLANDSSPLGRALLAAVAQQPGHGALTFNADGSFRYQPAAGFTGTDTFSYKLDDGLFPAVGPVVVTLNVTSPPDAASDAYVIRANEPFAATTQTGVLANDRSAYGNPLTAQLVADVTHGRLTLGSDGSFTYVPTSGYSGTDQFTYSARDGSLTSEPQTVTLVVNFPPVGREDAYLATTSRTLQVPASAGVLANDSDADGGTLSVTLASGPQHGSLTLGAAGDFTYIPVAGFVGSDTFTYDLHDGTHVTGPVSVTIAVERPPEAVADAWFVYASDVLTVPASAGLLANDRDPSGRPLTVELLTAPAGGGLTLRPDGSFTYAPNRTANDAGDVTFLYRVGNGRLFSDPVAVTFHVWAMAAVPDQYHFGPAMVLFPNRGTFDGGSVKGNDRIAGTAPAGTLEGMTVVLVNGPAQGKLTLGADGTFTYSSEGFHGAATFRYRLTGAGKASEPADVRLIIPPVAPRNDRYSTLDEVLTVPAAQGLLVNDPSGVGNPLQVTAVGNLTQGKLDLNADGSFSWMTPFPGFRGQAKFTYRVTDGTATSMQKAEVTITAGTPTGRADSYVVGGPEGLTTSPVAGVLTNDPTGRWVPQAAELLQGPTRGLLHFQPDGSFSYFPFVGFSGSDTFTYRPTDALGPWEPVTVTLSAGPALGWTNLAAADFNGDGTPDQLGRRVGTNDWWVTQGGPSPLTFRWVSQPRNFAYSGILVGDVTGDGRADLLTRIAATGRWIANLSTGFGFLPLPWAAWSRSVAWVDARLGDVNGDGRLDLIGRVPSTGQWWVGISTDLGARGAVWATWERRPWVEVRVADVNGDGRADVVARDVARRVWVVGYSDRRGRFVSRTFRTDPLAGR